MKVVGMLVVGSMVVFSTVDARADSSPDAKTDVRITSDWPETEVVRHAGTSFGSGYVDGRSATVTTIHLERLCRAPCTTALQTEGSYYVDAPGMHARAFRLPAESKMLKVRVNGASATPLALSGWATLLGGTSLILGGTFWVVFGGKDDLTGQPRNTTPWQAMTFVGGGVLVAGILGLVLLPRTHVETDEGARLDARASAPAKSLRHFTGNGFVF